MRERPIIMSAPAVRAILAGTKTQTRRVVKIKNLDFVGGGPRDGADWNDPSCWGFEDCNTGRNWALASGDDVDDIFACPYGLPGDRLWVRETWRADDVHDSVTMYRTDVDDDYAGLVKWRSPIHMPRDRSRLTLEITDVRVERQELETRRVSADAIHGAGSWAANPWLWVVAFRQVA